MSSETRNKIQGEIDYEKIVQLFKDKTTANFFERQISALNRVCRQNEEGFPLMYANAFVNILKHSHMKLEKESQINYLAPLIAGKPFKSVKSSIEYSAATSGTISKLIEQLVSFLKSPSYHVRVCAIGSLLEFVNGSVDDNNEVIEEKYDLRPSLKEFNTSIIGRDSIIEQLSNSLKFIVQEEFVNFSESPEIDELPYIQNQSSFMLRDMLCFLREISSTSHISQKLVAHGCTRYILNVLQQIKDFKCEHVQVAVEILWNFVENENRHSIDLPSVDLTRASDTLTSPDSLLTIFKLLQSLLMNGFRNIDKGLRNDVLVMLSIAVSKRKKSVEFVNDDLIQLLISYSTSSELNVCVETPIRVFDTSDELDLQYKILSWRLLAHILSTMEISPTRSSISASVVPALVEYIDTSSDNVSMIKWTPSQYIKLQRVALQVLHVILPVDMTSFQTAGGVRVISEYLKYLVCSSGSNGGGVLLINTLSLLLIIISTAPTNTQVELAENEIIEILISLIKDLDQDSNVRNYSFTIISILCKHCEINQERLRKIGGIETIVQAMNYGIENTDICSKSNTKLLLVIIDVILYSIIGNSRSEYKFLVLEGLKCLLDVLDTGHEVLKPPVISCLADILQSNSNAVIYFNLWRGESNLSNSIELLIQLWKHEEKKRGVSHDSKGILLNLHRPLDGSVSQSQNKSPRSSIHRLHDALAIDKSINRSGSSDTDLLLVAANGSDLRPKIFSIIESLKQYDAIRPECKLQDQIPLRYMEQYDVFLEGQKWQDIKMKMKEMGVKPISSDHFIVEKHIETAFNKADETKYLQTKIHDENMQAEDAAENKFNSLIYLQRDQKRQSTVSSGALNSAHRKSNSPGIGTDPNIRNTWSAPTGPIPVTPLSPGYRKGVISRGNNNDETKNK